MSPPIIISKDHLKTVKKYTACLSCTAKMILQKTYFFSREYEVLSRCKLYALLLFNHLVAMRTLENKNENAV
jgi:hypothetical protein